MKSQIIHILRSVTFLIPSVLLAMFSVLVQHLTSAASADIHINWCNFRLVVFDMIGLVVFGARNVEYESCYL